MTRIASARHLLDMLDFPVLLAGTLCTAYFLWSLTSLVLATGSPARAPISTTARVRTSAREGRKLVLRKDRRGDERRAADRVQHSVQGVPFAGEPAVVELQRVLDDGSSTYGRPAR